MGRARRRNTPQTAAKRAREQDYRDRRRRAALEREQYRELAEQLRPVDAAGGELVVELLMRMAAAGDESALRILTWREHLNAVGVEFVDELDERTFDAVCRTHAGSVPRSSSSTAASVVSETMAA
ncbi:hypothetical protein [Curtobacterium citreum]|uniref:hypothetical protein n=1 Tax=Curtobacterium citreum TaxID=2036 RepID=UPI0007364A49|nr:hypothetical protein [Curtobacterium citreum]KTR11060.1 hypothetical protein NS330_12925 [Curtobacterium citreum]